MGHTLDGWQAKVGELVRDVGSVDLTASQIVTVGLAPAMAKYSTDRPRTVAVEVAGAASSYLDLPAGWLPGFSTLSDIEFPARQNPPRNLDPRDWRITRDPSDITVQQILLLRHTPAASQYVRLFFTAPWPMPTGVSGADPEDPMADLLDDLAFEAVAALAASFCCVSLAGEASRSRSGALPSDFSDGRDRGRNLMDAARMYRSSYDSFVGIGTESGGDGEVPASGSFDFDPSYSSIFHGGRR
jgi:hypothetical protein